jgi:superfamily II DNA/RNA helicase
MNPSLERRALQAGATIVVGTPGRCAIILNAARSISVALAAVRAR